MSTLTKAWTKWRNLRALKRASASSDRTKPLHVGSDTRIGLGSERKDLTTAISASDNLHATSPPTIPSSIHLPLEIWEEIIAHVTKLKDLSTLARTCRLLRNLSERSLYRHLEVETSTNNWFYPPKLLGLYLTLQSNRRIESLVTECDIVHKRQRLCPTYRRHLGETSPCNCAVLDSQLGMALLALGALRVLRIDCRLCTTMGNERHQYLSKLPTRTLQELELQCQCSIVRSQLRASILSSQAMSTIVAFRISTMPEYDLDPRDKPDFLLPAFPALKVVNYDKSQLMEAVISQNPVNAILCANVIGYLALEVTETRLSSALSGSPAKLETLFMGNVGPWLLRQLELNPAPYSALCSLASIALVDFVSVSDEKIVQIDAILSALPRLESLELSHSMYSSYNTRPVDEALLHFLTTRETRLRRIYIVRRHFDSDDDAHPAFQLTKDSAGSWHRSYVPYLRYWEIVKRESIGCGEGHVSEL